MSFRSYYEYTKSWGNVDLDADQDGFNLQGFVNVALVAFQLRQMDFFFSAYRGCVSYLANLKSNYSGSGVKGINIRQFYPPCHISIVSEIQVGQMLDDWQIFICSSFSCPDLFSGQSPLLQLGNIVNPETHFSLLKRGS